MSRACLYAAVMAMLASSWVAADEHLNQEIGLALHNVKGDFSSVADAPFNDESHACIGEKAIAALGEGRVRELGVTQGTAAQLFKAPLTELGLTEIEIDGLLDAVDQCIPFHEIWVFLAMNAKNTGKLIKNEEQRDELAACLAETPGRQAVRDAWRVLFTQPQESFQVAFDETHGESMGCFAQVFCGPAYVGAVITPGMFQTMITKGACPF